jgi:NADPH-dependent glutamate synthase beta subunit-like oxidoreductase
MPDYKKIAAACTHGEAPACSAACPFKLDIRTIVSRLKRGSFDAAYRLLRDEMVFPETAVRLCDAPCQRVCHRTAVDEAVGLRNLELAVIAHAKKKEPLRLNVPPKAQTIAVIGAGISGLACAQRLASRRYAVTVYEKDDKLGGSLWERFPDGSFSEEINLQFRHTDCRFIFSKRIESLHELGADAVYAATGFVGNHFGKPGNGVLIGGGVVGAELLQALCQGIKAADDIEAYLKTGRMPDLKQVSIRPENKPDPALLTFMPAVKPSAGVYTPEEAAAEAERCIKCDCDICLRRCPLINYFRRFPKQIAEEVEGTVHPLDVFKNRLATRLVASCDQCGICKEVCPQGVDVSYILTHAKIEMVSKKDMPKAFSDFWLRDMEHAEVYSVQRIPAGKDGCRYLFFPGCQLGANDPSYVTETYERLCKICPETALLTDCCGAPAFWAGFEELHSRKTEKLKAFWVSLGRPVPITACPTCAEMLRRILPGCRPKSLYTFKLGDSGRNGTEDEPVSVFDPCAARYDRDAQESVRQILTDAGYRLEPLKYEKENTGCCGWGGQYRIANPQMSKETAYKAVSQSPRTFVTYCTNCRDTFAGEGKQVFHILDILLGINDAGRRPPTYTQRRENREKLQGMLAEGTNAAMKTEERDMTVFIDEELSEKLSRDWILEEDIRKVLNACEETGQKVLDREKNCFIGHLKLGHLTYWAVYRPENNGFRLLNAYAHRMDILEQTD